MKLQVKLAFPAAKVPTKYSNTCFHLHAPVDVVLYPREQTLLNLGLNFILPEGIYGQVGALSSLANFGVSVFGSLIRSGCTNPLHLILVSYGHRFKIEKGDRIAEVVFFSAVEAEIERVKD